MDNQKEKGQRAYEAWYGYWEPDGKPKVPWEEDAQQAAWHAVEQACAVPADSALLRRDWAVRVLDELQKLDESSSVETDFVNGQHHIRLWCSEHELFSNADPHAARLAAAEAVWPELPESVRAEIGPLPELVPQSKESTDGE